MLKTGFRPKIAILIIILGILFSIFYFKNLLKNPSQEISKNEGQEKEISLNDNGIINKTFTKSGDVKSFFLEKSIKLNEKDVVVPDLNESLLANTKIFIKRSKKVSLNIGNEKKEIFTQQSTVKTLLSEENILYSEEDKIMPSLDSQIFSRMEITIIRVSEEIVKTEKEIPFETTIRQDPNLEFEKTKILQEGINGLKNEEYKIIFENGKETKRTLLSEKIVKEPQNKIVLEGTKIKPISAEIGFASWYFGLGLMCAAHKYLPFGAKVKVTNKINGKSVIVVINDRGPYVKSRIIDLSDDAFLKIASLGAGIIPIIMERIK